jgi:peptidoglycan/LPS O-acetylase OafA/YrhL
MTDNRLLGADFVRTTACLTVLFHHLAQRMKWDYDLGPGVEWFRVFAQMGTFGVAMFFVLSGFLLARPFWQALDRGDEMPSIRTYAMRRAARILPGFWLALTVTFILSVTVFSVRLDGQLMMRYFAGLFLVADWHWLTFFPVEINGPLWSIGFEITSYVLLPLGLAALFLLRDTTGRGWLSRVAWLMVIGLAVLAHWLFTEFYPIDNIRRGWDYGLIGGAKWWMPRYNPFAFFAMFAIGALAAGLQVRWAGLRHWIFDALCLVGIFLGVWVIAVHLAQRVDASGFGWLDIPYNFPWFQLSIGLVLAVTPSSVLIGKVLDNRVTRYLATISFGIYIWHYVVLELVRKFWAPDIDHGSMADPAKFVVVSGAITLLTIIIAHFSFYLVENPVIQWARGRERRSVDTTTLSPAAG